MEIRNSAEALKAFLGVTPSVTGQVQPIRNGETAGSQAAFAGDRATLSRAATEVSQTAAGPEVRMERVAAIRQALAAGTYRIPASEVADKVIDAMSAGGLGSSK